jgi:hypothetical protein
VKIEIKADKDAVLGGPDHIPYLKLELRGDGHAVLQASHRPSGRNVIPVDELSGAQTHGSRVFLRDRMQSRMLPRWKGSRNGCIRFLRASQSGTPWIGTARTNMPAKPALKLKSSSTPRNGGIESARCGTRMIGFSSWDILARPRTMALALTPTRPRTKLLARK